MVAAPPPRSAPSDPSPEAPAASRAATKTFQGTTRTALHRPGLGDLRTPASGAPAFAIQPGVAGGPYTETKRSGADSNRSSNGPHVGPPPSGVIVASAGPPQPAPIASRNRSSHSSTSAPGWRP